MPPDFFNSREDAILVWTVIGLAYVCRKDFRTIRASALELLKSLLHVKLLLLLGSALVYVTTLIYVANSVGVWHLSALKATIYWYVGTAVVLLGRAVTEGARGNAFLRGALRMIVVWTLVIEFVVNVYALPLAIELVGVFTVLALTLVKHDPTAPPATLRFIDRSLVAVGLFYLLYFFIRVLAEFSSFATRANVEEFLVPPALTLALVPFLLLAAWWSRREQEHLRKKFTERLGAA